MARASVLTLLSLGDYAKQMGINPLWFNGAFVADTDPEPFPAKDSQNPYWYQHNWQKNDIVSRETLAETIAKVEQEIADFLGYWPAPRWISEEVHNYPQFHRNEFNDHGVRPDGTLKVIKAKYGRILNFGERKVDKLDTVTVVYSDPQTVGFNTLGTISLVTALTNVNEIKLYFKGKDGSPLWEIRPLKSKAISGGIFTATVDSWDLIDPDIQEQYPLFGQKRGLVDLNDVASVVDEVDIYQEYYDTTERSVVFFFNRKGFETICPSCGGSGCVACSLIIQDGCASIKDANMGLFIPQPATYDAVNAQWNLNSWANCISPDLFKIWYRAGDLSNDYLSGWTYEPMANYLRRAIAIMATSRLTCTFRTNNNIYDFMTHWQREINQSTSDGDTIFTSERILNNPFGTRRGEVEAFNLLAKIERNRIPRVGVL